MIEGRDVLAGEMNDLNLVLLDEPKNYHGWQYRQWLVQRFDAWEGEVAFLDELLIADHYNNSAWNHRYFVLKSRPSMVNWDLEALFVEKLLIKDPLSNQSILNYLYGITKGASEEIKGKFYSLLKSLDLLPSFNSTYNL